jgi:cholesterol oxidase
MKRLSSSIKTLRSEYETVVIGSGYGGSVAAAHLAKSGLSVCILERGPERHSGEYPKNLCEVLFDLQLTTPSGHYGRENALFDLRLGRDVNVLAGNGLGGTSLINAGVVLEPARHPGKLPYGTGGLGAYRSKVKKVLDPQTFPSYLSPPQRMEAFSAAASQGRARSVPMAVRFEDGPNTAGVFQRACNMCGDCITGCNFAAKGTLLYNYLPMAHEAGAEIYTGIKVRSVVSDHNGKWLVSYVPLGIRRPARAPEMFIRASRVILAAGVLGSTEILLRSRELGLELSRRLGEGFSSNGDALGFAYGADKPVGGVGFGRSKPAKDSVGPTITMMIEPPEPGAPVIEDAAVPSALGGAFAAALGVFSAAQQARRNDRWPGWRAVFGPGLFGPYRGKPHRTLTMLAMGKDDGTGRFGLVEDRLDLRWIGASAERVFSTEQAIFSELSRALGAEYITDPFDTGFGDSTLITVHPLGGCAMGQDSDRGVVDEFGRVYRGESCAEKTTREAQYHKGLFVLDGSILPGPIGINPLLTISALAQRGVEHMLAEG